MHVHHLNCISTCPLGGRLMDGLSRGVLERGKLSCHCLVVESNDGLILIDTGFGLRDVADPKSRLSHFFLQLLDPDFQTEATAVRQIERLGFKTSDVRHIVLSHLDFDHAGGLDDFPHAKVHMLQREREGAARQKTWLDRQRFRPQQWTYTENWLTYGLDRGESWFGFSGVQQLAGLPPEILLVPLLGHTLGHAGIAIQQGEGWLFYAADAYFYHRELDLSRPYCTPGLRLYQRMMDKDRPMRLENQQRLRRLHDRHQHEVEIFCAHDLRDYLRFTAQAAPSIQNPIISAS